MEYIWLIQVSHSKLNIYIMLNGIYGFSEIVLIKLIIWTKASKYYIYLLLNLLTFKFIHISQNSVIFPILSQISWLVYNINNNNLILICCVCFVCVKKNKNPFFLYKHTHQSGQFNHFHQNYFIYLFIYFFNQNQKTTNPTNSYIIFNFLFFYRTSRNDPYLKINIIISLSFLYMIISFGCVVCWCLNWKNTKNGFVVLNR